MYNFLSHFVEHWRLIRLYFFSKERIYAGCILFILVIINLGDIGLDVSIAYWNKYLLDRLEKKDQPGFIHSFQYFCLLWFASIVVYVHKKYLTSAFLIRWRRWLTHHFLQKYFSHHSYYLISSVKENETTEKGSSDNPDQRISMDIDTYIRFSYALGMGIINAFVSMVSFIFVLWKLSDVITIDITSNCHFKIYGFLVWCALIYAVIGN